jgi:hypothetical protein
VTGISAIRRSLSKKNITMQLAGDLPKLEVLAPLERELLLGLARRAFLSRREFSDPSSPASQARRVGAILTSRRTIFLVVFAFLWKTGLV